MKWQDAWSCVGRASPQNDSRTNLVSGSTKGMIVFPARYVSSQSILERVEPTETCPGLVADIHQASFGPLRVAGVDSPEQRVHYRKMHFHMLSRPHRRRTGPPLRGNPVSSGMHNP